MTPFLTAPNIPFRHGFFTREGGVSGGIFASLNCGPGSNDTPAHIAENRARVAAAMGAETLHTLYQVHSARAVIFPPPQGEGWGGGIYDVSRDTSPPPSPPPSLPPVGGGTEADALVTATPGVLIGVLTADCAPVLLADAEARVVAAAHAGWKGAFSGIMEATVAAMESLGAARGRISAAIGPCIAQCSYEVGPEFVERLADRPHLFATARAGGKALFNLKQFVEERLREAGISHIHTSPHDTCAQEPQFFSYRRATLRKEPGYGRQVSCIVLDER